MTEATNARRGDAPPSENATSSRFQLSQVKGKPKPAQDSNSLKDTTKTSKTVAKTSVDKAGTTAKRNIETSIKTVKTVSKVKEKAETKSPAPKPADTTTSTENATEAKPKLYGFQLLMERARISAEMLENRKLDPQPNKWSREEVTKRRLQREADQLKKVKYTDNPEYVLARTKRQRRSQSGAGSDEVANKSSKFSYKGTMRHSAKVNTITAKPKEAKYTAKPLCAPPAKKSPKVTTTVTRKNTSTSSSASPSISPSTHGTKRKRQSSISVSIPSDSESDMEGGFDELEMEESRALKAAKKEDLEALEEETRLKREKLERKRKLEALSKVAAGKKKY